MMDAIRILLSIAVVFTGLSLVCAAVFGRRRDVDAGFRVVRRP